MEQDVLRVLAATQNPQEGPRRQAEAELMSLYTRDDFPLALITIASTHGLETSARQAAAVHTRIFIDECWTPPFERYSGPPLKDHVKQQVRQALPQLLSDPERKIRSAIAFSISKIAAQDFPEEWPSLLQDLMNAIPHATNDQLHGILKVLNDLVEDGFNEEQFFAVANQLIESIYCVVCSKERPKILRALAVKCLQPCIGLLEMVKDDHPTEVQDFVAKLVGVWIPFFLDFMSSQMLQGDGKALDNDLNALQLQILKAIPTINQAFPRQMKGYMVSLFSITWEIVKKFTDLYVAKYVVSETESRLVDQDDLPYGLDLLMLEELDFLQTCLNSKTVKEEFFKALQDNPQPLQEIIQTCLRLAQITSEEEGMWEQDHNIFLAEETSVMMHYTCRTVSSDLLVKFQEWLGQDFLVTMIGQIETHFNGRQSWNLLESCLYLLDELFRNCSEPFYKGLDDTANTKILSFLDTALMSDNEFLRSRGYVLIGTLCQAESGALSNAMPLLTRKLVGSSLDDSSDIVKISCIRVLPLLIENAQGDFFHEQQLYLIDAIGKYLSKQDQDDREDMQEILATLAEAIKAVVELVPEVVIKGNSHVVEILFSIANSGASNIAVSLPIQDLVESMAVVLADNFEDLCRVLLPPIMNVLHAEDFQQENPASSLASELLATLLRNARSPLPSGLVDLVLPTLAKILVTSTENPVLLQNSAEALKYLIEHDVTQVINWHSTDGKSGLEVILVIIDRLLRPELPDESALRVGDVAAELVDKASNELGPFLLELLKAVAGRLVTAGLPNLIQSLILVFARLVISKPRDVVDFLAAETISQRNALELVISAWLENSTSFSGFVEIRQNVIALSQLFSLQDPRIASINVQGDQIISQSNKIMTRAQTKNNPIRYTIVPAPVKIVKLLVAELTANTGSINASAWKADGDGGSDDDEWEDDVLDLGSHATKQNLLALAEEIDRPSSRLRGDDETHSYLLEFFREVSSKNLGNFREIYEQLSEDEQQTLNSAM